MKKITSTAFLLFLAIYSFGQLNPLGGIYYQNQYLANPAMAGVESGFELNGHLKGQWTAIEGAPLMQALTFAYGSENKRVGLGAYLYNETAGAFIRTNAKITYSYHLALNVEQTSFIDFGVSGGVMNERVDFDKLKGDLSDISLVNFNERKLFVDGDFGIAFRSPTINIQAAVPNLKRFLDRDVYRKIVDRTTYIAAVSYKFIGRNGGTRIEPKLAYRGVQNYKDIIDAGIAVGVAEEKLNFSAIYHSTNSVTLGIGTVFQNQFGISAQYTTNTSDLQGYSNGEFEIGLKYNWK